MPRKWAGDEFLKELSRHVAVGPRGSIHDRRVVRGDTKKRLVCPKNQHLVLGLPPIHEVDGPLMVRFVPGPSGSGLSWFEACIYDQRRREVEGRLLDLGRGKADHPSSEIALFARLCVAVFAEDDPEYPQEVVLRLHQAAPDTDVTYVPLARIRRGDTRWTRIARSFLEANILQIE